MKNVEYISMQGLADQLQISKDTIRGWIARHWRKGNQYVVLGRTTLINIERANRWIKSFENDELEKEIRNLNRH